MNVFNGVRCNPCQSFEILSVANPCTQAGAELAESQILQKLKFGSSFFLGRNELYLPYCSNTCYYVLAYDIAHDLAIKLVVEPVGIFPPYCCHLFISPSNYLINVPYIA